MSYARPRWCKACGHLHYSVTGYCAAHRDLHALDGVPANELESLPTMGDELSCDKPEVTRLPSDEKLSRPARSADSEAAHRPDRVSARKDRVTET